MKRLFALLLALLMVASLLVVCQKPNDPDTPVDPSDDPSTPSDDPSTPSDDPSTPSDDSTQGFTPQKKSNETPMRS